MAWKSSLSEKLQVISRPQFSLSLLEVSHFVVDVRAPGGASGNFQSRVRRISLQAGVHPGELAVWALYRRRRSRRRRRRRVPLF
jgi:hypothetical protein